MGKLLMPRFPVKIGRKVDVWVTRLDEGRLALSMFEGGRQTFRKSVDLSPFEKMDRSKFVEGEVAAVKDFGVFVRVEAPDGTQADGLLLPGQIKEGVVEDLEDEMAVGEKVKVRIAKVDVRRSRLQLSMLKEW